MRLGAQGVYKVRESGREEKSARNEIAENLEEPILKGLCGTHFKQEYILV